MFRPPERRKDLQRNEADRLIEGPRRCVGAVRFALGDRLDLQEAGSMLQQPALGVAQQARADMLAALAGRDRDAMQFLGCVEVPCERQEADD